MRKDAVPITGGVEAAASSGGHPRFKTGFFHQGNGDNACNHDIPHSHAGYGSKCAATGNGCHGSASASLPQDGTDKIHYETRCICFKKNSAIQEKKKNIAEKYIGGDTEYAINFSGEV